MGIQAVSDKENLALMYNHIKVVSEIIETARVAAEDGIEVNMQDDFKEALKRLNELAYELRIMRGGSDLELHRIKVGKDELRRGWS